MKGDFLMLDGVLIVKKLELDEMEYSMNGNRVGRGGGVEFVPFDGNTGDR